LATVWRKKETNVFIREREKGGEIEKLLEDLLEKS
jgi:hypothetical protein